MICPEASALVERLLDIRPVLEDCARESETSGRLARASLDAMRDIGAFQLWWPEELGGPGATITDGLAVIERAAYLETTAAWNLAVGTLHAGFVGAYLQDTAVAQIFDGSTPIIAGQMAPRGEAVVVKGGIRVSGSWSFGSGIHQANWLLAGATLRTEGADSAIVAVVPIDVGRVDESSWEVLGLSGTGSCDYHLDDVFVPAGYWFGFPSASRLRGGGAFDLPVPTQTMILHAGFALGAMERSLEEAATLARLNVRTRTRSTVASRESFQTGLVEARMRLTATRLYIYDVTERLQTAPADDGRTPLILEARAATRFATDAAVAITTWAYRSGGGASMRLDHPLQRILRDVLSASQHVFVDETALGSYGAALVS